MMYVNSNGLNSFDSVLDRIEKNAPAKYAAVRIAHPSNVFSPLPGFRDTINTPTIDTQIYAHCFRFGISFRINAPTIVVKIGARADNMPVNDVVVYFRP